MVRTSTDNNRRTDRRTDRHTDRHTHGQGYHYKPHTISFSRWDRKNKTNLNKLMEKKCFEKPVSILPWLPHYIQNTLDKNTNKFKDQF